MGTLTHLFNILLYQPLFNFLILLYDYLPGHDFGIAVIFLTVSIKLIFYPIGAQAIRSQKTLSELQPKIQEVQNKYKNDREKQAKAMMELYKEEKINPFSGCLPLLIQLPILIALYRVFWKGLSPEELSLLYSFVPRPGMINASFLGIVDLSKSTVTLINNNSSLLWPNVILVLLAGITQFIQTKMVTPKTSKAAAKDGQMNQFSGMLQKQMLYFFPVVTVFFLWKLPSALALYWVVTTVFTILQQYFLYRPRQGNKVAEIKS